MTPASHSPWHSDIPERLRAMLPEALVSIVAATCIAAVMSYRDGADVVSYVLIAGVTELIVQPILYACTYIIDDRRAAYAGIVLVALGMPLGSVLALLLAMPESMSMASGLSTMMGALVFYCTRSRVTHVILMIEMLSISAVIDSPPTLLLVHLVGAGAIVILFVMRSSATRITMLSGLDGSMTGAYGQIAAFGVAVAALCVAVAIVGGLPLGREFGVGSDSTVVSADAPAQTEDDQSADVPDQVEGAWPEDTQQTETNADTEAGESPAGAATEHSYRGLPSWLLVTCLLAVVLVLPFAVRLLARAWVRRSLEQEPRASDRVAKIYLRAVARLEAMGIVRDEAQTPREFSMDHGEELKEHLAPVGMGLDEWTLLTQTYEKARYADLDPTASELATCWKLYDALPACARSAVGLPRYLLGVFWHM